MSNTAHMMQNGYGNVAVRFATDDDCAAILELFDGITRWLWQRGINQWDPRTFTRPWLEAEIGRHSVVVGMKDEVVGTALLHWSDAEVWGEQPPDAGYVHKLAVKRSHAGQGIGAVLLEYAAQVAAANSKQYLRLDCATDNRKLVNYYRARGFQQVGTLDRPWRARLFQKRVSGPVGGDDADGTQAGHEQPGGPGDDGKQ
ncbi:MAG: hypothetical protein NVS2B7_09870 [Herpetosiphon sp.]